MPNSLCSWYSIIK